MAFYTGNETIGIPVPLTSRDGWGVRMPDREALARVIDPEAWAYFDTGAGQHYGTDLLRFERWKQSSLTKADAILAMLSAAPKEPT